MAERWDQATIERAAEAAYNAAHGGSTDYTPWPLLNEHQRVTGRRKARAALEVAGDDLVERIVEALREHDPAANARTDGAVISADEDFSPEDAADFVAERFGARP